MTEKQESKEEPSTEALAASDKIFLVGCFEKREESPRNGVVHIQCTFKYTLVTVTIPVGGNVIAWFSAEFMSFKGSRKSTPFAAQVAAELPGKAVDAGMKSAEVFVKGPGSAREAAIRAIQTSGLVITMIKDVTPNFP